ncbi:MAG: DNA helicase RecQ [Pirellulaceae bacterium]
MNQLTPLQALKRYWGYENFLPLQQQAIDAALNGRDAMVVMPTGGGKSLCYQIPAVIRNGLTVVVSPLISLMKDQVDTLRENGIAAAALNSSLSTVTQNKILTDMRTGNLRLLYVAPERLMLPGLLELLQRSPPLSIAIDEAHCISSWGHDFRPEYRTLHTIREKIPGVPLHAFTATATPQVRTDIITQLRLNDPEVLVGNCHRPNLIYHVKRREPGLNQICSVIDRFRNEAGIIYAISRAKVESISDTLNQLGYKTRPYHAGLSDQQRADYQNSLVNDEIEAIVATVAFGMGIDKSNVRYVIHAEMPKSVEAYQQESGRAGRDGLESECWLFHSPGDFMTWQRIIENSPQEHRDRSLQTLKHISNFCTSISCRHKFLVEHFGQKFDADCQSCDICLGKVETIADPLITAQKIVSCVYRCNERFGAAHIVKVLTGSNDAKIVQFGHDKLSTWGLMKDVPRRQISDWIEQLLSQNYLEKTGEYPVLNITPTGWQVLRGELTPSLLKTVTEKAAVTKTKILDSWEGVDRALFEQLRGLRAELAAAQQVPAFIIFSDATLRDIARRRPTDNQNLLAVHGIGERKATDYGQRVIALVHQYCESNNVDSNIVPPRDESRSARHEGPSLPSDGARESFKLFDQGLDVPAVCNQLQRATSTVYGYLEQYIRTQKITDATRWLDPAIVEQIEIAVAHNDTGRLKPTFDALNGTVSYESIRIVVACMKNKK